MADNKRTKQTKRNVIEVPSVDAYGHKQPQQLEFEQAVLGALLIEQEAFPQVNNILTENTFYDHKHQVIYRAISDLNSKQQPVDILTVPQYLEANDILDEAGGLPYILQLSENVHSAAHVEYMAKILHQKYQARRLITFASRVLQDSFDPGRDVDETLQETEAELFNISQQTQNRSCVQINEVIAEALEMVKRASAQTGGISGLTSGFEGIDKITNGWQNSDLVIIAARPAMGKTAFVLSMIKNMAVDNKIPVAMFSLEMSNVQLVNRLIVNVCQIEGQKIKTGQLSPPEWTQLDARVTLLQDAPIYVDDTPSLSIYELRTKARRLKREHNIAMIVIDYLQLMNASGMHFGSRQEEVSMISRNLKALAKELNIPIVALSQLNRGVEAREGNEGKRPQLSDLRESGAIEQDADMVCFIHRPEYYKIYKDDNGHDLRGMAEFIIAKHRNGAVDDVLLRFHKDFARFADPHEDDLPPLPGENLIAAAMTPEERDSIVRTQLNAPYGEMNSNFPDSNGAPF
ncbi:MAG: replicative DNA helicase [Bacteroidaceae bacterium]|nr:replicative DNA helicase [Bacteroidaceae bacterium]